MKVTAVRKLLLAIPREEWDNVTLAASAFTVAAAQRTSKGSRNQPHGTLVHRWISLPSKSDGLLLRTLGRYRHELLERLEREEGEAYLAARSSGQVESEDLDDHETTDDMLELVSASFGHAVAAVVLVSDPYRHAGITLAAAQGISLMALVDHLPQPDEVVAWWRLETDAVAPFDLVIAGDEPQAATQSPSESEVTDPSDPMDSDPVPSLVALQDSALGSLGDLKKALAAGSLLPSIHIDSLLEWNESLTRTAGLLAKELDEPVDADLSAVIAAQRILDQRLANAQRDDAAAQQAWNETHQAWGRRIETLNADISTIELSLTVLPADAVAQLRPLLDTRLAELDSLTASEPVLEQHGPPPGSPQPRETDRESLSGPSSEAVVVEPDSTDVPAIGSHVAAAPLEAQPAGDTAPAKDVRPLASPTSPNASSTRTPAPTKQPPTPPEAPAERLQPILPAPADEPEPGPQLTLSGEAVEAIVRLLSDRRYGAAYWVAECAQPGGALARAFRHLSGAFLASEGSAASMVVLSEIEADLASPRPTTDHAAATVEVVAAARASLALGWAAHPHLESTLDRSLPGEWRRLLDEVNAAARFGYVHSTTNAALETDRASLGTMASEVRAELTASQLRYHAATQVLRYLLREGQVLDVALTGVTEWSGTDLAPSESLLAAGRELSDRRCIDRLIDRLHEELNPLKATKGPIVAAPRQQLYERIQRVLDLVAQAVGHSSNRSPRTSGNSGAQSASLVLAAVAVRSTAGDVDSIEAASMRLLADWIIEPTVDAIDPDITVEQALLTASIPLVDAERGPDQSPVVATLALADAVSALLAPSDVDSLVDRYCDRGNLAMGRMCAGAAPTSERRTLLEIRQPDFALRAQEQLAAIRADYERARVQVPLEREDEATLGNQLQAMVSIDPERCDIIEQRAAQLRHDLAEIQSRTGRIVTDRLTRLGGITEHDRDRIEDLVRAGDLSTAEEFLGFLTQGKPLPSARGGVSDLFDEFILAMESLPTGATSAEAIATALGLDPAADERAAEGLKYLADALDSASWGSRVPPALKTALLLVLGLADASTELVRTQIRGVHAAKVRATPLDGSLVPGLGSRATHYSVILVHRTEDPTRLLDLASKVDRQAAHVILVPWLLSREHRRQILTTARKSRITALVVDAGVAGFLAAKAPRSFRALQQVTLPYSVFSHYAPNFAGDVPQEVFVGRTEEIAEITSPTGSLYVYGGRQLGKSAVLRRVQHEFDNGGDRVAIYLDLKSRGIGEFNEPDYLWTVLLEELKSHGVLANNIKSAKPEAVVPHVKKWLQEDTSRRILLLLDEADLFLESENSPRSMGTRQVRFPNVLPLKDLMDSSNRRFKVVFAGLHQVQRFSNISNTPLAHGGRDIEIGPLEQRAALQLVEDPLRALGYRLADPDLAWRLLAFTNYQPGLVQIVCDRLITEMQSAPVAAGSPPITIRAQDVQKVIDDRGVRTQVAERFRLTISLEDRYRVMALVLAYKSLSDSFMVTYRPDVLLSECAYWWPEGFATMDMRAFQRYLEEMEGLGVLIVNDDGEVAVRSANIVRLLGRPDEIDQELQDGGFMLPHEYNPRFTRRVVELGKARLRSPLTEDQLGTLLPTRGIADGRVFIVVGNTLAGIDHVTSTVEAVSAERGMELRVLAPDAVAAAIAQRDRQPILVDARGMDTSTGFTAMVEQLVRQADTVKQRSIVVVDAQRVAEVLRLATASGRVTVEPLNLWNQESLRSWGDLPFDSFQDRMAVVEATGGWPQLVEDVVSRVQSGSSLAASLSDVAQRLTKSQAAGALLRDLGIADGEERRLLEFWTEWVPIGSAALLDELSELAGMPLSAVHDAVGSWRELRVVTDANEGPILNELAHRVAAAQSVD